MIPNGTNNLPSLHYLNKSHLDKTSLPLLFSIVLFAWGASHALAEAPKARPSSELAGFATVNAYGISTTTGGGKAPVTSARTAQELQEAINAAPSKGKERFYIQVKPGTYKEKLVFPKDKCPITIYGENAKTTILTYDDYAGKTDESGQKLGTGKSYSVKIESDDFAAENITFQNEHKKEAGEGDQALALSVTGDRAVFRKCRFTGWQDTLYIERNRQYFEDCYISGQVDYIFGGATAFFERCELHCVAKGIAITAASTPQEQQYGYVFSHCKIMAEAPADWKTYLGRPWKPYASVTYLNTELPEIIAPAGWDNWRNPENEKTARFAEYRSTGPGASSEKRVPWSKQLTEEEAANYTVEKVLKGADGWNPTTK
jgi:pectinesterase